MLVENREVDLIRPPVLIRPRPSRRGSRGRDYRVLAFAAPVRHVGPSPLWLFSYCSLLSTLVAIAPFDDHGFVDLVARVVGGRQLRVSPTARSTSTIRLQVRQL